ncbi:MAG TPA: hypothetical protein VHC63_07395 [Acidimicrobiales bacterium]|nr:hypothetical protein [Acidimicrobiales bacterium]
MTTTTWHYGDLEVTLAPRRRDLGFMSMLLGLLGFVVTPLAVTGWVLVHFFPLSVPVAFTIAVLFGIGMFATAVDEE